jgi:cytochrome P450
MSSPALTRCVFCRTLILAGQHTTSVGLSRILHVLSLHPEKQHRLRIELMDARVERRDISYDDLMALPYLDAVCKETLRLCVILS